MDYNLFLDDVRQPMDVFNYTNNQIYLIDWNIARNYDEFISIILENGIPNVLSLDHDLHDTHYNASMYKPNEYNELYSTFKEKTGYDCAKWLISHCIDNNFKLPETILIHSMNPIGSINIESLFKTYCKLYNISISINKIK